jgi:hypothetical protein
MSAAQNCPYGEDLCSSPEFDLTAAVDDPEAPAEVTVYPADADADALVTTWVSADVDAAVDLADAR